MKMTFYILLIAFIPFAGMFSQDTLPFSKKSYSNWYFGHKAGITFNTQDGEPVFLDSTILGGGQNTATLSDKNGNFLFHTNGKYLESPRLTIVNSDMGGNGSQTEGSVLASLNGDKYIFFSTLYVNSLVETTGLIYSIFSYDWANDSLIFHVYKRDINKNYHSEAIQLTYSAITNKYILVGADSKGVISAYEFDLDGNYLRSSSQPFFELPINTNSRHISVNQMGDKIAVSSNKGLHKFYSESSPSEKQSHIYFANLNPITLEFYDYFDLEIKDYWLSTFEFSSNTNFVYFYGNEEKFTSQSYETLFRYDLRKNNLKLIYSSPHPISNDYLYADILDTVFAVPADLKIAPNEKIYISRTKGDHLSSIESPNNINNSDYRLDPLYLDLNYEKQTYCDEGLPSILSAAFADVFVKSEIIICEGETLELFAKTQIPDENAKYSWVGPKEFESTEQNPQIENIKLDQAGLYIVTVKSGQKTHTAETFVKVKETPKPEIRVYPKEFLCEGDEIFLNTKAEYTSYEWTTGDTTQAIRVTKSGTYGVTVTSENGCEGYAEIKVGFAKDFEIAITGDTAKCIGESVTLTSADEYEEYEWSTGETSRSITVVQPGYYTLTVLTEEGCEVSRTIQVKDHAPVDAELMPTPTTICEGDSTLLEAKYYSPYYIFEWNTGATTRGIYASETGTYKLRITDTRTGCSDSTEIAIKVEDNLQPEITGSNICSGASAILEVFPNDPSYTYEWSNGATTPVIEVNQAGTYTVTVSKAGCTGTAETIVNESPNPEFEIQGESIICNNETATLTADKDFEEYLWSTNEITKSIEVNQAGTYTLTVTDENGCSATKSFKVEKYELNFTISNSNIDFGKVYISETKTDRATLTNNSGFAITLENGEMVQDGQTYEINYNFVPSELGFFGDAVSLHVTEPCDTTVVIPITARVYARATISTDDIYTEIGRTETVPVYLECEADLPTETYEITTDIDRSVFFTSDSYIVSQNQPINKTKTKIHELTGTVLLSDDLVYDITFPSYKFDNTYIEVTDKPGKIYIDSICIFNYRNIAFTEPTTLTATPTPATEQLNISITTGMQGTMHLELVSTDGRVIYTNEWHQTTRSKQLQLDTRAIPSGLYQLRLITPYDAITTSVVVVE